MRKRVDYSDCSCFPVSSVSSLNFSQCYCIPWETHRYGLNHCLPGPQLLLRLVKWEILAKDWSEGGERGRGLFPPFLPCFTTVLHCLHPSLATAPEWFLLDFLHHQRPSTTFSLSEFPGWGLLFFLLLQAAGCLNIFCWYSQLCLHACKKLTVSSGNFFVSMNVFPFKTHTNPFSSRNVK